MHSSTFKLLTVFLFYYKMVSTASITSLITESSSEFSNALFNQLVTQSKKNENIVFSPVSVQTCVSLAFFGAKGETAQEISKGLNLRTLDKQSIAQRFSDLIKSKNSHLVQMANRIYVNQEFQIKNDFNSIAKQSFQSEAEPIDFKDGSAAVNKINTWVAEKTNNNIQNLLSSVEPETKMILVNAIHMKAQWVFQFDHHGTHESDFWITPEQSVKTNFMTNDDDYGYAEWSDLDATAIDMPYKDLDLSMVIVLPNKRDGLADLERKIQNVNILKISNEMSIEDVDVVLPKFKIESEFQLNDALKNMGMSTMFTDSADFGDLFENGDRVKVSEVVHKAFINVDEEGTEASAATYMKIVPMSLNFNQKRFRADHPFLYYIKSKDYIYFMGHVTNF